MLTSIICEWVVFNISVHLTWFRMSWSRGSGRTRRPCWSHWPAPSYWPSPWPSTKVRKLPGSHEIYAVQVMNILLCLTHILCYCFIQLYWSGWTTRMLMSTGLNRGWLSIQRYGNHRHLVWSECSKLLINYNIVTCTRVNVGIKSWCTEPKKFYLFICFFHFINNLLGNTRIWS